MYRHIVERLYRWYRKSLSGGNGGLASGNLSSSQFVKQQLSELINTRSQQQNQQQQQQQMPHLHQTSQHTESNIDINMDFSNSNGELPPDVLEASK